MSIKSSIDDVSNILVFYIIIIITKIECGPVFKQDPKRPHPHLHESETRVSSSSKEEPNDKKYRK